MLQRKRAKPTTSTPNTIMVGVYIDHGQAAITVSLRSSNGQMRNDVFHATGEPYEQLARTLMEVRQVDALNLLILTNDAQLHRRLHRPFRYDDGDFMQWPKAWWRILTECTRYCFNGDWQCLLVNDLPKARELLCTHQPQPSTTV